MRARGFKRGVLSMEWKAESRTWESNMHCGKLGKGNGKMQTG